MAATPPATLEQASVLLATDPAEAGRMANQLLRAAPNDPRAALILASARRRQGDAEAALALLEPLARAFPRAALTHYELGAAHAARGADGPAIAALRHALGLQRDLPEAWRALGDLLFRAGDIVGSDAAYAEHARASVRDPLLAPAADALLAGDAAAAERLLRAHLNARPAGPDALQMLADALARQGGLSGAAGLLERALDLDPAHDGARFALADVLFRQQKGAEALPLIETLFAADPSNPAFRNLLAACQGLVGDYDRAIELYEALLADFPKQPRIWLNYGHTLRTLRRREEATDAYLRCIDLAPSLGDAYWSLANLKTAPISAEIEAQMAAQMRRDDLTSDDRLHLHYALGKALEDRGDHTAAFENFRAGAALRRAQLSYDAADVVALTARSKALFTKGFFAARDGAGSASDAPIFIVGLPRSGSTLIEQILASHSAVEGTMELPDIGLIAAGLIGPGKAYPDVIADLSASDLAALGEAYLARTAIHRRLGRAHFIDKMPNNFLHVGLIQLILPNAKIIDARRHPLGSCFSAFKQHFAYGHAFSYDQGDLGRYYRDYVDLMAHVDTVLPGRVCRVIYEDLVEDTETQVRRLLDHCGLPFEPGCLTFYENDRPVRTVSSEQVRRPIFRDGLDLWKSYEPWLGPLKAALGPALETWR